MSMIILPYPRAYVDWAVPNRPDGTTLVSTLNDNDYYLYVNWLADYLYEKEIPIPESQRDVHATLFQLSENLSLDWLSLCDLETHIKDGGLFSTWHQKEVEAFESLDESDKEIWIESSENGIPDYLTEAEFNRIAREVEDANRVPQEICHLDIPYRAIISRIFKEIPDHGERVAELDRYFKNMNENFSK